MKGKQDPSIFMFFPLILYIFFFIEWYIRAWLEWGFLFFFSKQYKNNFQKIEIETSFQIIIFILYVFGFHF